MAMKLEICAKLRRCCVPLLFVATVLCSVPIHAAMTANQRLIAAQSGVAYLIFKQNGDGSWGVDNAERLRATNQALWALQSFQVSGVPFDRALNWVYNAQAQSPDATARLLLTLSQAKVVAPVVAAQLDAMKYTIVASGQTIKQWGAQPNFMPSVLDDIYALEAILLKKYAVDSEVLNYWAVLASARNTAGGTAGFGWGYALSGQYSAAGARDSAIIPTAEALLAMDKIASVGNSASYWDSTAADAALNWLVSKQNTDGSFGDAGQGGILSTALVAQTIVRAKYWEPGAPAAWQTALDGALDYLKLQQQPNGSWLSDVFTSAVATQAMLAGVSFQAADTDHDGLPDSLESLLSSGQLGYQVSLNPNAADAYLLERSNGENFRDMQSGLSITMDFIVGAYDSYTFNFPYGQIGTTASGAWPPGMAFNAQTLTLSGVPNSVGVYSTSFALDYGPNVNRIIPVTIYVVNGSDDLDGDGMSNAYEHKYSNILNSLVADDGALDSDGDGVSNLQEAISGTDPNNNQSYPAIITSVPSKQAQVGRLYEYTVTTNVASPTLTSTIKPTGSTWNSGSRKLSWTPTSSQLGDNAVAFDVSATGHPGTTQSFVIKVTDGADGDINGDGVTDIADVYLLEQYLLGAATLTAEQKLHADVSSVGSGASPLIDIADLYALQSKILNKTNP